MITAMWTGCEKRRINSVDYLVLTGTAFGTTIERRYPIGTTPARVLDRCEQIVGSESVDHGGAFPWLSTADLQAELNRRGES